jgi:hypothetical protein
MDPEERRWWLRASGIMLLLTLLPLVVAALASPRGYTFSGFVYEARDGVSYVAKATEGLEGRWLYHDPYTSEAQPSTLIYTPYLVLGQLDRPFRVPLAAVIQVARLALAVALLQVLWRLAAAATVVAGHRRLAFLLVLLGGGVGAFTGGHLDIFGYHFVSLDVSVSGTVGLQTLSLAPHVLLACLGSAWLGLLWVRQEEAPRWRRDLLAGTWSLLVSAAYPQVAVLWAVIAAVAWLCTRQRRMLPMVAAITAGALPYAAYGMYLKQSNPVFASWPPHGDVDVGDPLSFILFGHLLMLPFALLALRARWRGRAASPGTLGLVGISAVWLVVAAVLMYMPGLPAVMQRVFYGSFIPFGLLTADGLWRWSRDRPRPSRRMLVYPAMLMCVAGAQAVGEGVATPLLHRDDAALYFPTDEARVLRSVARARPGGGGLVMNSFLSGLFVPGLSGQDTYIGFPFETLDLTAKNAAAVRLYRSRDPGEVRRLAARSGADYLLWGRYEQALGGPDPGRLAGWPVVASSGRARVYAIPDR